jgi:hypothetical protein
MQRAQYQVPSNDPNVQGQPGCNDVPTATPSGPTLAGATGICPPVFFNPLYPLETSLIRDTLT